MSAVHRQVGQPLLRATRGAAGLLIVLLAAGCSSHRSPLPVGAPVPALPSSVSSSQASSPQRAGDAAPGAPALLINPVDGSELVRVPAGAFTMGSDQGEADERPAHTVVLDAYWIGRNLVTNRQFVQFLNTCGNRQEHGQRWFWPVNQGRRGIRCIDGRYSTGPQGSERPVVGVSWDGARAYCAWAGLRLPTEAEFEKAARGTDARTWPWGEEWADDRLTCLPAEAGGASAAHVRAPSPVGSHPRGASPYGCLDMAGNAWEWCSSLYATYPYRADDGRERADHEGPRVVRGGGFRHAAVHARTTNRYRVHSYYARGLDKHVALSTGFRVARSQAPGAALSQAPGAALSDGQEAAALGRLAHPPMAPHAGPIARPAAERDARHRLLAGRSYPAGAILGLPIDEERERRYVMPLERLEDLLVEDRDANTQPVRVLEPLHLRPGAVVADLGAGSGYFSRLLCRVVGQEGQVWATDISVASLRYIQRRTQSEAGWPHPGIVRFVLHDCTDCLLPPRYLDAVLMSQAHYFVYPHARAGASPRMAEVLSFYRSVARSLKPGGILVIHEDSEHHMDQDPERGPLTAMEIIAQLRDAGFTLTSRSLLRSSSRVLKARGLERSRHLLAFTLAAGRSR